MLITHIHTDRSALKCNFRIHGTMKHVNQLESYFREFDPKQYFFYHIWIRKSKKWTATMEWINRNV